MDAEIHFVIETVLVVDDSSIQRQQTMDVCRSLGIDQFHQAADGSEALLLLGSLAKPPSLAIVDLEMPGMDGVQFLQEMVAAKLPIPVIVASGMEARLISSVETMIRELGLPILAAFQKPLTHEKLTAALGHYMPTPYAMIPKESKEMVVPVADLAYAIYNRQIVPHYQPQVDVHTGMIKSVEALARWNHPQLGAIAPSQFIPLAELKGLIHGLTFCIVEQALADLAHWHSKGMKLALSLNLSPRLLTDHHIVEDIGEVVHRLNADAQSVIWEITESSVLGDIGSALGTLARLRLKGFGLSIDDYGTGFSSMQQLSRIPFTELKIDQSFVIGASSKPHLRVILQSAIDMAHKLKLKTVAEGVETLEDWQLLQQCGCDMAQGYLIAKPMPGDQLVPWLHENSARLRQLHA
jgi:EAL domain-containing protein (putative c-di-GMP-specific phosphodiesterase class I)/CheY-like chemotaxis protein